ncbi:MAG: glycosyltransferase family 4 protein [Kiritimatiellae bacterium]|nr:glycosyltransferase family 4 protein [Kiritimatiellia bacterium]
MRVLWIETVGACGGGQMSLFEACRALSKTGEVEVAAVIPPGDIAERMREAGIPVFLGKSVRGQRGGVNFFRTLKKLFSARDPIHEALKRFKPDIIHANSLTAFLAVKRQKKIPMLCHVRDIRYPVMPMRAVSHLADGIIAASPEIETALAETLSSRVFSKIKIVTNGIDLEQFKPGDRLAARKTAGLPERGPLIGMVAYFVPWKRHNLFLRAAATIRKRLPDAHFVIVGRDLLHEHREWIDELRGLSKELGLEEAVSWITNTSHVETLYPAMDLLIHPAVHEPFGRVVCEAMAARVPVIAASPGGPDSIITPGQDGLLIDEGDPDQTAQAALELLADPDRMKRMADAAFETVTTRFSIRRVADELLAVYRGFLQGDE